MGISDANSVGNIIWLQNTLGFQDIYIKRDGKCLLDTMGISESKCVWDMIWLQNTIGFCDVYRKRDGK